MAPKVRNREVLRIEKVMIKNKTEVGEKVVKTGESFDGYRRSILGEFESESIFFKKRLTQGLIWTSLDKDLANQYWREERWFYGVKYRDELRIVDHGVMEDILPGRNVGFKSK